MKMPLKLTESQIDSACLSYDHSFNLEKDPHSIMKIGYNETERNLLRWQMKSMYDAIRKELCETKNSLTGYEVDLLTYDYGAASYDADVVDHPDRLLADLGVTYQHRYTNSASNQT